MRETTITELLSRYFIATVLVLLSVTGVTSAQDEPVAGYTRPQHKVYKSLAAALQQPDSVFILELKGKKLKEFPLEVFKLTKLQVLDLSRNKIRVIPPEVDQLQSLEELNVTNNKIKSLPESIGNMKHLKMLALNRNVIETLPASIGQMEALEILELWDNEIGSLPDEIRNLKHLKTLELRGILFSDEQQQHFRELLPHTRIYMSPGCDCKTQ